MPRLVYVTPSHQWPTGATLSLERRLKLLGEAATLRLDGEGRLFLKPHQQPEREHAYAWQNQGFGGDCVLALQRHVLAHRQDGAPLENTGSAYLRNLEIEEAVYRSAASGRWERLAAPQIEPASTM